MKRRSIPDGLLATGLFTIVVLANGLLAILLIGLLEAVGLWGAATEVRGALELAGGLRAPRPGAGA